MPERRSPGFRLSFFGMVGAVMVALKLKENWDGYNQVASDEEGRVALRDREPPAYQDEPNERDEEGAGLLNVDTQLPTQRPKRKRPSNCCVCCGVNIGLFCKALGIVTLLFTAYGAIKLIIWVVTPSPSGLEGMPAYSESLGCLNAPHLYQGGAVSIKVPYGSQGFDHVLDIRGKSVGTITLMEADADATDLEYTVTTRSTTESALEDVKFEYPSEQQAQTSRMLFHTPWPAEGDSNCARYDMTLRVPHGLKKLAVNVRTLAHVQFKPDSSIDLDSLHVTLFAAEGNNMLLPQQNVRAKRLFLEVFRGWIVGDVSTDEHTSITTQRGDGVANVRLHPTQPLNSTSPETCDVQTTTGSGRTDLSYIGDKRFPHRPIKALHMSSRNGDVYLTYRDSEFSGRVALGSNSYSATGLQSFAEKAPSDETNAGTKWTHWVGEQNGVDQIIVKSRGWTGLYF
ncbi:hypothetical protein V5O48_000237 [Marasmius crinis-equi]|uniref:Uncharacterized protein n=1 Tax=Marasmius crinis-equi TaxID=585013 RepID=A0ABR3G2G8_9AGAR